VDSSKQGVVHSVITSAASVADAISHLRRGSLEVSPMQISVIMPVYNEERFLAEAIESVLAQTYRDFELIILDDGSQDRTREIAESYALLDSRIRVESNPNMGIAAELNRGIALSANEWIALMQGDDVLMPNRLERNVAFLDEHPELAVAGGWSKHIDSEGRIIARGESPLVTHEAVQQLYEANEVIAFNSCTALLRKSAVLAVGGYRAQFRVNEDVDMWCRLLEAGYKILVQPEYLVKYRIHSGSVSIGRARHIREELRWYKASMLRRRSGQPELTWDEYLCLRRALPWYVRANAWRKDTAKVLYKSAVFHYAERHYHWVATTVLASMLLQPGYILHQIAAKLELRRA
jgi:glycosyltransferase involved in cell wall biosynthesis